MQREEQPGMMDRFGGVAEKNESGWDAGIRTPIRRSRVCSLTVRRRPNERLHSNTRAAADSRSSRSKLKMQDEELVAAGRRGRSVRCRRLGGRLESA